MKKANAQRAPTGGTVGTTVNHIGFAVPNLRKLLDKVKADGFSIVTREEVPPAIEVKDDIAYVDAVKSRLPPPRARISGIAASVVISTVRRLRSIARSNAPRSIPSTDAGPGWPT